MSPANSSRLANGFLISWARMIEISARTVARRAASRSCSACLFGCHIAENPDALQPVLDA